MKEVIAMHGWSESSNIWKEWIEPFEDNGWLWQSGERGYGNKATSIPQWNKKQSKNNLRVVIAHSLGQHLLEEKILKRANVIILLCSFSRFIPEVGDNRVLKASLKGMRQCLGTRKEKNMLNEFLKKACYPNPTKILPYHPINEEITERGRKKLLEDINLIINTTGLPIGFPREAKVLVVDSQEDLIVVPKAKTTLLRDLKDHISSPVAHWSISNTGHTLLVPNLKSDVLEWMEACL